MEEELAGESKDAQEQYRQEQYVKQTIESKQNHLFLSFSFLFRNPHNPSTRQRHTTLYLKPCLHDSATHTTLGMVSLFRSNDSWHAQPTVVCDVRLSPSGPKQTLTIPAIDRADHFSSTGENGKKTNRRTRIKTIYVQRRQVVICKIIKHKHSIRNPPQAHCLHNR